MSMSSPEQMLQERLKLVQSYCQKRGLPFNLSSPLVKHLVSAPNPPPSDPLPISPSIKELFEETSGESRGNG
jgi:hypothetical protein